MPDYPTAPTHRAAIPSRRLLEELTDPRRFAIYYRAKHELDFGRHWLWRHGGEALTAGGLRALADVFDREHDEAGATVCRRLAAEVEGLRALARPAPRAEVVDTFAMLERRGLA